MKAMDPRRMCPHCRAFITVKDRVCPYCNETVGPRAIDRYSPAPILGGLISHARFTTVIILLLNFGLYVATVIFSMQAGNGSALMGIDGRTLVEFGAKYTPLIAMGQWWRLVTAGFLHGGILHILMNSWVLFDLGTQVEEVYGTSRMLVIYFVSTVCGFYLSAVWSASVSVGASAALMGLIGAMIAFGVSHRSALGDAVRGTYIRWAIYVLIFGLLPGFSIDNAAHVGGLAAGFGCAWLAGQPRLVENWKEKFWRGAAVAAVALTVFSFLKWYLWFRTMGQ
jgi:rhomboid protease GluP